MWALLARLKSLGLILKASGAITVVWSEMHSGQCPRLQKVALERGWRRIPACPGTRLGGGNLGGTYSLVELRHFHGSIMSHVISAVTELGRRSGPVF